MKSKVLCVAGPTASGKSALGMELARRLNGEIIGLDSMQLYRRMDIGTAKPTRAERAEIAHHLVDILEPWETYTAAQYAADARQAVEAIAGRGKVPILVGGTGFYLSSLTRGLTLGGIRSDWELRDRLKALAQDETGKRLLHERLASVDPASAKRLHPNDITRVSRALEVYELTGVALSAQAQPEAELPFELCILGTELERSALYARINARVVQMMKDGLLSEVEALLQAGVSPQAQAMQGIGYKELVPVLSGQKLLPAAVLDIQQNTRRYAKRQLTWFRRNGAVRWLDMAQESAQTEALHIAQHFLEGRTT
jgi:tRNA dimethylallyltransferase